MKRMIDPPAYDIAVMIPTRGRKIALFESLKSCVDRATNNSKIIYQFAFDNDDTESMSWFNDIIVPWMQEKDLNFIGYQFDRLGYHRLNEYVNYMAGQASAEWLMFFNDDALMETYGWDEKILEHRGEFLLLAVDTNNHHPHSVFPILPKAWFNLMGHISPHPVTDGWVSEIAYLLDILKFIDVKVKHDRFDLTGNNNDDTFKERNLRSGNPDSPEDINYYMWVSRRHQEADKIAWFLQSTGKYMGFWKNVTLGTQDPWIKLRENDINNQMIIHSVNVPENKTLDNN